METFGIIMAGGGGERFWPLSRKTKPKQLQNLSGNDVMVNEAIERLSRVCACKNIFVVTNRCQAEEMRKVTAKYLQPEQTLAEPAARNTAACIGYAAVRIRKTFGDGVMVVTPSDAYIRDNEKFAKILQTSVEAAEKSDCLVTVGIQPTFPATGYGYIRFQKSRKAVKEVLEFVEKPSLEKAEAYLASGEYVWNSGMFIWKASVILQAFKQYLPDTYELLMRIGEAIGTPEEAAVTAELYPQMRSVSIDYGIMEKANNIYVVSGAFGWSDVGSWDMLSAIHHANQNGNVVAGDFIGLDTTGTVVYSKEKLIATVGISDVIIVDMPDAVLVCAKERAQDVKKIVEMLRARGREELL